MAAGLLDKLLYYSSSKTYIVTAKIFALTAYRLLKGGAAAAKKLVDDYKPIFTKQEYIDFMESMISKKTGGAPVFEEE